MRNKMKAWRKFNSKVDPKKEQKKINRKKVGLYFSSEEKKVSLLMFKLLIPHFNFNLFVKDIKELEDNKSKITNELITN